MSEKRPTNDPVFVEATLQDIASLAARHNYAVMPAGPSEAMVKAVCKLADIQNRPGREVSIRDGYRAMIEAGRVKP